MVTQHVRGVEITEAVLPPPAPPSTGDIIVVVGPAETDPTDSVFGGPYRTASDAEAVTGTDGLLHDAIVQIFSQGSRPDVYAVSVGGVSGDTVPTRVQMQAALDIISVANIAVLYAPGQTSGSTGAATGVDDIATEIKTKCNELGCLGVMDAPYGAAVTNANRVTWATANLNGGRTIGYAPSSHDDKPLGGEFLGVWNSGVAANGRGTAGSPHGRVITGRTAAGLSDRISRNPRVVTGTDESRLVNAGCAVATVRGDGAVVVSMTDFPGINGLLRFWTVRLGVDHLSNVLEETLDRIRNHGPVEGRLEWIADQLQLSAQPLVRNGELARVNVEPDVDYNTPAVITAGTPRWLADVSAPLPIVGPSVRLAIGGAI